MPRSALARYRYPTRAEAERFFPHRIDVPVPPEGLGRRLSEMLAWCRDNVAALAWDEHGRIGRREDLSQVELARFYFMNGTDAEAFKRTWM